MPRVPALRDAANVVLLSTPSPNADEAHKVAVDALRKFRQGPGLGRNPGQQSNRPGRSRWPEGQHAGDETEPEQTLSHTAILPRLVAPGNADGVTER